MRVRTTGFFVDGMVCRRCVREVTSRLRDVPGAETLLENADRSTALASFSTDSAHGNAAKVARVAQSRMSSQAIPARTTGPMLGLASPTLARERDRNEAARVQDERHVVDLAARRSHISPSGRQHRARALKRQGGAR